MRRFNFGRRLLQQPLNVEVVAREIGAYDAFDAMDVSRQIRATAGLEGMVDRLLQCYAAAISEYCQRPTNMAAEMREVASFLRDWPARLNESEAKTRAERFRTDSEQLRGLIREELKRDRRSTGVRKWLQSIQKRWLLPATIKRAA
jgi:hypothetical protein